MKISLIAIISVLSILFPTVATSGSNHGHHFHRHHGHHGHHHRHHDWVWPALIGGAVVYAATRPDPVIVQQPTVVLQPNQVIIDGVVYTKQYIIMNGIQTEVLVRQ